MAETAVERAARLEREGIETGAARAARLRAERLAAGEKKLGLLRGIPGSIEAEQEQALAALGASTEAGAAQVRRRGAEQLAAALGGARPTGLGARLAAARGLGKRGLTAEAEFRAEGAEREAVLRRGAAERLAKAQLAAAEGEEEFIELQKGLGEEEATDKTARIQDALSEINEQLPNFDDLLTEDEEGAANMIRNVALRFRDIDPDLADKLNTLAQKIQDEDIELEDVGSITPAMLGL